MKHLTPQDYRVMPWKNGGGTTTELYLHGEGVAGFDWRISIATVPGDGPFSRFPGYDRHIMAIEGDGFILDCASQGQVAVSPAFTPRRFSGDWDTHCRLLRGPCRDFNLMARRADFDSTMELLAVADTCFLEAAGAWLFLHIFEGSCETGVSKCVAGDSLLLPPGESTKVETLRPGLRMALCRIRPLS